MGTSPSKWSEIGRRVALAAEERHGRDSEGRPRWNQNTIAADTGYSPSAISRALRSSRISLELGLALSLAYGKPIIYWAPNFRFRGSRPSVNGNGKKGDVA